MRSTRYAIPALATLALIGGLAAGTFSPPQGVGTPIPAGPAVLQEDDPGWDCTTMGNRVCGPTSDADRAAGWAAWDFGNGPRSLKVDPSRPYRVEYAGISARPSLGENQASVIGRDFQWHVFTVTYTG